jgi:dolichyl-phosphate-mannose--protein O-mannosyl transferase
MLLPQSRHYLPKFCVALLLITLVAELALSIRRETQTWDEACHLFAGYSYWTRADFGMNPEHPPLVKVLAALPPLPMSLRVPVLGARNFKVEAFLSGEQFVYSNDAEVLRFRARLAAALLSVLLAGLVFLATREMFGAVPALIALTLLAFDPNLLAHGALVTTDVGLSCFLFAAVFAFYRHAKQPSKGGILLLGLAAGCTLATKHSGVLVFPILALLALVEVIRGPATTWRSASPPQTRKKQAQTRRHPGRGRPGRAVRVMGFLWIPFRGAGARPAHESASRRICPANYEPH